MRIRANKCCASVRYRLIADYTISPLHGGVYREIFFFSCFRPPYSRIPWLAGQEKDKEGDANDPGEMLGGGEGGESERDAKLDVGFERCAKAEKKSPEMIATVQRCVKNEGLGQGNRGREIGCSSFDHEEIDLSRHLVAFNKLQRVKET